MRQSPMLKIREPCNRRKWQAPPEKASRFEHHVDLDDPERLSRLTIEPERKCAGEACTASIERGRAHNCHAGNTSESVDLVDGIMRAGKQNGRDLAWAILIQRGK